MDIDDDIRLIIDLLLIACLMVAVGTLIYKTLCKYSFSFDFVMLRVGGRHNTICHFSGIRSLYFTIFKK